MKTIESLVGAFPGSRAINVLRVASTVVDGETVTIGNRVYEVDDDASITAGNIAVDVSGGATGENFIDAILPVIAANPPEISGIKVGATKIGAAELLIWTYKATGIAIACAEGLDGANNAWAAAAMYGGEDPARKPFMIQSRVPNATEVALGNMHFYLPFTPVDIIPLVRVTSGLAAKAWDGGYSITGGRVTLNNGGSTDWAATDTVTIIANG